MGETKLVARSVEWFLGHFRINAPERLRALQTLNEAHYAVDLSSLVSSKEGPMEISSRSWTLLTRQRLGLPLDSLTMRPCPGCSEMMDVFGDHILCCPHLGLYARHNEIRNEFGSMCQDMGLQVEIEVSPADTTQRPADVLIHGLEGQPLAVDFAVVHTLQSSINLADVQPGKLARQMEHWKVKESQMSCARNGWSFTPFVLETLGSWGGKARYVLQKLIKQWALHHACSKSEAAATCRARLALALVRGLSRQLERGFPLPLVASEPMVENLFDF